MASTTLSLLTVHTDGSKADLKSSDFLRDLPSSSNFLMQRKCKEEKFEHSVPSSRLITAKEGIGPTADEMKLFNSSCIDKKPLISNKQIISFLSREDELHQNTRGLEKKGLSSGLVGSFQQKENICEAVSRVFDYGLCNGSKDSGTDASPSHNQLRSKPLSHQYSSAGCHENLQIVVHSSNRQGEIPSDVHKSAYRYAQIGSSEGSQELAHSATINTRKEGIRAPRVLPSVGAFAIQCASCMKWRLAPSKEHYERIRQSILETPFYCSSGRAWNPKASCDAPPELSDDSKYLWAIDKPNIPLAPEGWQRLLVIRGAGASKFADIYYVAPNGKKLRSMPDVERFLAENPSFVMSGRVSLNQFSFVIPSSLDKNYCRKRANPSTNAASAGNLMRGAVNQPAQHKKLLKNSLGKRCEPLQYRDKNGGVILQSSARSTVLPYNGDSEERFSIVPYTPAQPLWSSANSGIKYLC